MVSGFGTSAFGINAAGDAVGCSEGAAGGSAIHAVLWPASGGGPQDLDDPASTENSCALAINNLGQVVGYQDITSGGRNAFLWDTSVSLILQDLNGLIDDPGGEWLLLEARDINDAGQIVGIGLFNGAPLGFLLTGAPPYTVTGILPLPGHATSEANALNEPGHAAGRSDDGLGTISQAFLFAPPAGYQPLDPLLGCSGVFFSGALDLNKADHATGISFDPGDCNLHPFFFDGGSLIVLPLLPLQPQSRGNALNDLDQVVGGIPLGPSGGAFLWQQGNLFDLNQNIPTTSGWILDAATDINNSGRVVGTGTLNGGPSGFFLMPVLDLALEKSASPAPHQVGKPLSFFLKASHIGTSASQPVAAAMVKDQLPPGMTFVSASPGCQELDGTVSCGPFPLNQGESVSFTITVLPTQAGAIPNTATLDLQPPELDPDLTNNAATLTVDVLPPPLLEVTAHVAGGGQAATAALGSQNFPVLPFTLAVSTASETVEIHSMIIVSGGSGNDQIDISAAKIFLDVNADGVVDGGDALLASGTFPSNDGSISFPISPPQVLAPGQARSYIVAYDFSLTLANAAAISGLFFGAVLLGGAWKRRRKVWLLGLAGVLGAFLLHACCNGTGVSAPAASIGGKSSTYQATLSGLTASGQTTGSPAQVTGLPVSGAIVVVSQ